MKIHHIWFDLEGTLAIRTDQFHTDHDQLRYETFAELTGKPLTTELKEEFEALYKQHGSNSAVFRALGQSSDFWQERFKVLNKREYYQALESIPQTLQKLRAQVPISLFTNLLRSELESTLARIGLQKDWFTFTLMGDDVKERKPALDGFYEMIRKSQLPAEEILYVGDRVNVDLLPAKSLGMQTCLAWGKSDEADYSVERFEELLNFLA